MWLAFSVMTAAALFAVLWPLGRSRPVSRQPEDIAVYQDQLGEIERDRKMGLIGAAEGDAARIEVSRRLLAAADARSEEEGAAARRVWPRRFVAVMTAVALPAGAAALYLALSSPQLTDPSAAQGAAPAEPQLLVERLAERLKSNDADLDGWLRLVRAYVILGEPDRARGAAADARSALGNETDKIRRLDEFLKQLGLEG